MNIPEGKFDYFFGRATGRQHNLARTNQNAFQMKRLGVPDTPEGHALLRDHLVEAANNPRNVLYAFENPYGFFEVRESLFQGPSGQFAKFQTTWHVMDDGLRKLTTLIPFGGG